MTDAVPYRFSLCIDYRTKTLNLKNVKEQEYKYKTEDNCVSKLSFVSVCVPLIQTCLFSLVGYQIVISESREHFYKMTA